MVSTSSIIHHPSSSIILPPTRPYIMSKLRFPLTGFAPEFFDVKFYPYNPPGSPPIFAATSKKHVRAHRFRDTRHQGFPALPD